MKKLFIISIFALISYICCSQAIDNKTNIYLGSTYGCFIGKESIGHKNFIYPSLFTNYRNLFGVSLTGLYKIKDNLSLGFGFEFSKASVWELQESYVYSFSKTNLMSLSPVIQVHNKFQETGFSNRFKVFVEINPVIGLSQLILTNPLFEIQSVSFNVDQLLKSNDLFFGFSDNVGLEFSINQYVGVFSSYKINYNWINSRFYNDRNFTRGSLLFGAFVKLN